MLKLKRAYDPVAKDDGTRFLVERLWPRGLSKDTAAPRCVDEGRRTKHRTQAVVQSRTGEMVTVSRALLSRTRLATGGVAADPVRGQGRTVTLVYSSHDEEHNNAVALKEYLQAKRRRRRPARKSMASAALGERRDNEVPRDTAPAMIVRPIAAVSSRPHRVGASPPCAQPDRSLGRHDVPACDCCQGRRHRTRGPSGGLVDGAVSHRDGDAVTPHAVRATASFGRPLIDCWVPRIDLPSGTEWPKDTGGFERWPISSEV